MLKWVKKLVLAIIIHQKIDLFNFKFEFIYLIFIKYFEKNWKEMNRFLLYI